MVLSTEWSQVEVIDLINDGSGLGFGIVGGRSTGVVVKSILPGGIADKGRRLQSGDHILQIGGVNLKGLGSEQVAVVLRQAGAHVRMVVARPIEVTSANLQEFVPTAPIVPTKILCDPEEVEKLLSQNGYMQFSNFSHYDACENQMTLQQGSSECLSNCVIIDSIIRNSEIAPINCFNNYKDCDTETHTTENNFELFEDLPETECFTVELKKHKEFGLGITVAGYICEREDLNGIFIRSISVDSDAYRCNKIKINDRIVGVDDETLENCTNHEAIEKLKKAGDIVKISFERYLRGPKYDHLQEALLRNQENKDISPPSPTTTTLSWIPINTEINIEPEGESIASVNSEVLESNNNNEEQEVFIDENFEAESLDILEESVKQKWQKQINSDSDIVVLHLKKLTGLGISLEGTVEVEDGIEQNPRHFIRSILPEGPVGQSGKLRPGDEILEVNGQKLIGVNHVEAVKVLRNLPSAVRLVCARKNQANRVINTSQNLKAFEQRNILGGSLKNLIVQNGPKQLVKALSDTSINNSSHTNTNNNNTNNSNSSATTITPEPTLQKTKSRSLENTNVAMWSDEVEYVDLIKGDKGLGFSILDYQDPVDSTATIIVVRTLVPGGVAETNGKIQPGDCLISVNGVELKNVTLDQAVQALKGTTPGPVRLGIAKPLLPNVQSSTHKQQ